MMAGGGGMTSESVLDDNEGWEGDGEGDGDGGSDGAGDDDGGCEGLDCLDHQFICMPLLANLRIPHGWLLIVGLHTTGLIPLLITVRNNNHSIF